MIRHCATPLVKERQLVILQNRGSRIRLIFRHFSLCFWLQPVKTMARHSTRLSAAMVLLAVACLAFQAITQAFVATSLSRRDALQAAGFAAATLGSQAVWADAQGEPYACLTRYGPPDLCSSRMQWTRVTWRLFWRRSRSSSCWTATGAAMTLPPIEKYVSMTDELLSAADEGKKDVVKKTLLRIHIWSNLRISEDANQAQEKTPWPCPPMVPASLSFLSERLQS